MPHIGGYQQILANANPQPLDSRHSGGGSGAQADIFKIYRYAHHQRDVRFGCTIFVTRLIIYRQHLGRSEIVGVLHQRLDVEYEVKAGQAKPGRGTLRHRLG